MRFIVSIFLLFCLISTIDAQDIAPIQTDRPDQTESSSLVPKKYLQTELGFAYELNHTNEANLEHPAILLKYGLSNRFECRFISNMYTDINNKKWTWHWNEIGIGLKTKLTDELRFIPQSSLIMHYSAIWDKKIRT